MNIRCLAVVAVMAALSKPTCASEPSPMSVKCADVLWPSQCIVPAHSRTEIRVCVAVNGKVSSTTVTLTSGYKELDSAAISLMRRGKFKAGTVDGKPVASCKDYAIVFE